MPRSTQTPIVILGEALMDCIAQPNGSFMPYEGGSPYNVARAIALQGGAVTFINPLSTDELGTQLSATLLNDGVSLGMPANALPTSLAMVSFVGGQPSYQFYRDDVADRAFTADQALAFLDALPCTGILHTGSLALVPPEADKTVAIVQAAKTRGWIISCDINLRPRLARDLHAYRALVHQFIALADWIKASDEDLITLLGDACMNGMTASDVCFTQAPAVCHAVLGSQTSRACITFGAQGAFMRCAGHSSQQAAPLVAVVDTVGCGDTFWGTCLLDWANAEQAAGLPTAQAVSNTLKKAIHAAAINASRAGCQPPTALELAGL